MKHTPLLRKASSCLSLSLLLALPAAAQGGSLQSEPTAPPCSRPAGIIRFNQVGYYPNQEKVATVNEGEVESFTLLDAATERIVYTGRPSYTATSPWSDKVRTVLDFSSVTTPGTYWLLAAGDTATVVIDPHALLELADGALRSFYYQRASMPIEERHAGIWHRAAGHPDTHVLIHPSAAGPERKAGDVISSPGGWYDAGDYNKYIVNSGYSIGLMQAVYRLFPNYFARNAVHIPESGNQTPDLLDEMYYNLAWMLTMQDPADGGVYHKLTTPSFEGFIRPDACRKPRYVVQKSVTAALDFAACMAQASELFASSKDYPGFSDQALKAAERAYEWAVAHPDAFYRQNEMNKVHQPAVTTGEYGDRKATDEFFWASSELYLLTGKKAYRDKAMETLPKQFETSSWGNTAALGVMAWLAPGRTYEEADGQIANCLKDMLVRYADQSVAQADRTPFHAPYGNDAKDFFWGCLSEKCANQGTALVCAYLLTGDRTYLVNARRNMDYLLGRNATGYCYVTGMGIQSPQNPHHRLSASDDIQAPVPGLLVGGPNPGLQDKVKYPSTLPDEAYADVQGSYASNEIAINWSAALVALSSALDALGNK